MDEFVPSKTISWFILVLSPLFFKCSSEERRVRVFTATDYMLFDSNDLLYFEVLRPKNISYIYKVRPAKDFGGKFEFSGIINLVTADPLDACYSVNNGQALRGAIALVERGGCSFVSKTKTVESHGAIAVFIADKLQYINGEPLVDMIHDGTTRDVHIPAGFMLGSDGNPWVQSNLHITVTLGKWSGDCYIHGDRCTQVVTKGSQLTEEVILVTRFCVNTFLRVTICPVSGCIGRIEEKFDVKSCLAV